MYKRQHHGSPYVTAFAWSSSGFGSKYSNPSTLMPGTARGLGFSSDGNDIFIAHSSSPYISAYPWSSGWGTKYGNPSTLPTGTGRSIAFFSPAE